jgi:ribonuclease HII
MGPDRRVGRGRRPLVYRGEELRCGWRFEQEARALGYAKVAGADEVGRGALCGPVVAGAVILGEDFDADGIDDSKRLTALQRETLAARIRAQAVAVSLGSVEPREIDRLNILRATYLALQRAVEGLPHGPDLLLMDALTVPALALPQKAVI